MNLRKLFSLLLLTLAINKVSIAQINTYPWPSTGNVGIGTTSPDHLLTVNGIAHIANDLVLTRNDGNGASIVVDNVLTKNLTFQKQGGGYIDVINLVGTGIGLFGNTAIGNSAGGGSPKLSVWTNTSGDGIYISHNGSGYGGSSGFIKIHGPSLPNGGWNSITMNGDAGIIYGTTDLTANLGFVIAPVSTVLHVVCE